MNGSYVKRLLPLMDVVILLFGLMVILHETPVKSDVPPHEDPPPEVDDPPRQTQAEVTQLAQLKNGLLQGKQLIFLKVTEELDVQELDSKGQEKNGLGSIGNLSPDRTEEIKGMRDGSTLVLVFYPPGFTGHRFTPEKQRQIKDAVGALKTVLLSMPEEELQQ